MEKKIRTLKPEEIEVRVNQVTSKGCQLLLYKDSRCDKRILDETFGINGWKNRYEEIKGNLFCIISIWDDDKKQWIDKEDCGVESFSEKQKGEASDAFKRACFNIGIGRELYTRLHYFATVPTQNVSTDPKKPKYELINKYEKFSVSEIFVNEETEKIEKIKIVDSKKKVVFNYGYSEPSKTTKNLEMITPEQIKQLQTILSKKEGLKETVYKQLGIKSSKELTFDKAQAVIEDLKKKVK